MLCAAEVLLQGSHLSRGQIIRQQSWPVQRAWGRASPEVTQIGRHTVYEQKRRSWPCPVLSYPVMSCPVVSGSISRGISVTLKRSSNYPWWPLVVLNNFISDFCFVFFMDILPAWISVHHAWIPGALRGQKSVSYPLKSELQTVESCRVGPGNWTSILWKSSQSSWLLHCLSSHLLFLVKLFFLLAKWFEIKLLREMIWIFFMALKISSGTYLATCFLKFYVLRNL